MLFFYLQHISWVWSIPQDLAALIQFFAPEPSPSSLPGSVRSGHLCLEEFLVGLSMEATALVCSTLFLELLFSHSGVPHSHMDTASRCVFFSLFSLSKLKTKHLPWRPGPGGLSQEV